MMPRWVGWAAAWSLCAAWVAGCGDSTSVNPAPSGSDSEVAAGDGGAEQDSAPDDAPGAEAGPTVRTVVQRNPLGRLDPSNLLRDGDFELSGPDALQGGWLGVTADITRTGAECRSGLRCVALAPSNVVETAIVWPSTPAAEVSFVARTTGQDCEAEAIGVIMMGDSEQGEPATIGPESAAPVDGWCRYRGIVDVPAEPGYHYWLLLLATRKNAAGSAVFDDAVMHAVDTPASSVRAQGRHAVAADVREYAASAREKLGDRLPADPRPRLPVRNPTGRRSAR